MSEAQRAIKKTSITTRQRAKAEEMYKCLDDLRRAVFVNGGHPDEIMKIAQEALRLVRTIDNDLK